MKLTRKIIIIAFLFIIYLYTVVISKMPNSIILTDGDNLKLQKFLGITYEINDKKLDSIQVSSNFNSENQKNKTIEVKLFDLINVKKINIDYIENINVIPVGQLTGIKLYTNGVLVVGMSEIKSIDDIKYKPYENSGIEEGDRIIKINNNDIDNTNHLINIVNSSNGEYLEIQYVRNDQKYTTTIKPIKSKDGNYKLGLWIRDTAAGIGTITFYEPSTGNFAALGHGITDIDTGDLVEISNGEFITTKILSLIKGLKGKPRKNPRNNRK